MPRRCQRRTRADRRSPMTERVWSRAPTMQRLQIPRARERRPRRMAAQLEGRSNGRRCFSRQANGMSRCFQSREWSPRYVFRRDSTVGDETFSEPEPHSRYRRTIMKFYVGVAVLVVIVAGVVRLAPDIVRYLKIRAM